MKQEEADKIWDQMQNSNEYNYDGSIEWPGWIRMVERLSPDYARIIVRAFGLGSGG